VLRYLTVKVDALDEGPSVLMQSRSSREERSRRHDEDERPRRPREEEDERPRRPREEEDERPRRPRDEEERPRRARDEEERPRRAREDGARREPDETEDAKVGAEADVATGADES
jgi:hypothetical protein